MADGYNSDREAFIQHVIALRNHLSEGEIRVLSFLASGRRFADRHQVRATKTDGSRVELEVFLFGEVDLDGKILTVHEASRVIRGASDDGQLARIQG